MLTNNVIEHADQPERFIDRQFSGDTEIVVMQLNRKVVSDGNLERRILGVWSGGHGGFLE